MGSQLSSDDEIISGINVTPLVDVVLVLLIIFMITAPVLYQASLKVNLPKAQSGERNEKSSTLFTVTKSGDLLWDNQVTSWEALSQKLSSMKEELSQKTAIISADQETPHGTVIRLLDTLRQAGLTHFALNVQTVGAPK
ncbi:MAG: biopolymer transporter ExbD [Deltaproteobacteria bacterium]|nr:biopolymer transporter ExbD [Deltaproteobacteria bacterium]